MHFLYILPIFLFLFIGQASGQIAQDFESDPGHVLIEELKTEGWSFQNLNTNRCGTKPFDGQQSLVSGPLRKPNKCWFTTPYVEVTPNSIIAFDHKLSGISTQESSYNFTVILEDENEGETQIESESFLNPDPRKVQHFEYRFSKFDPQGKFRIRLEISGFNCVGRLAIDNIVFNGSEFLNSIESSSAQETQTFHVKQTNSNPSQGEIVLVGSKPFDKSLEVKITDIQGRMLVQKTIPEGRTEFTENLYVGSETKGQCFLTLSSDGYLNSCKILIE